MSARPSDAAAAEAAIDDARALVADPALPSTLKSRLTLAIDRHERLTQGLTPDRRRGGHGACHRRRHADCAGGA